MSQKLSQDIAGYKDVMEEFNEICEVLMEKCACSWVRDQTNEANDKYSALVAQIQGKSVEIMEDVGLKNVKALKDNSGESFERAFVELLQFIEAFF